MAIITRTLNHILNTVSPLTVSYTKDTSFFSKLSSLKCVFALFQATIHKSHLDGWVNLAQLQKDFPGRVQVLDSNIIFKGPVSIITSRFYSICCKTGLSLLAALLFMMATSKILGVDEAAQQPTNSEDQDEDTTSTPKGQVAIGFLCMAIFAATFWGLSSVLPNRPGIYFHEKFVGFKP